MGDTAAVTTSQETTQLPTPTAREHFPTDYHRSNIRCPNCGHRLSMVAGARCTVVNGDGHNEANDRRCPCRNHHRAGATGQGRGAAPFTVPFLGARCGHRVLNASMEIVGVCGMPLRFFGVKGYTDPARWYVADCGFYTIINDVGTVVNMTREEPRKPYFNGEA